MIGGSHPAGTKLRNVRLPVVAVPFVANSTQRTEIPRTMLHRQLGILLTGNLVVGTSTATLFAEAPLGLIKQISIICDGSVKQLQSMDGRMAYRMSHFIRRKASLLNPPLATVGTRAFSALIQLDHESWRMAFPNETLFDPRRFQKVELAIQWGSETDIATAGGGGGTIALSSVATKIISTQVGVGIEGIAYDRTLVQLTVPILATSPKLDVRVPQAGVLTGIMFRQSRDLGDGTGPKPVSNIINTVTLVSDQLIQHDTTLDWATLQSHNVGDFQLDNVVDPAATPGTANAVPGLPLTGYGFLDRVENGQFSSGLAVQAISETLVRLDVTRGSNTENVDLLLEYAEPRV